MARICVGQITSTGNMAENLAQCRKVLQKAFEAGAKVAPMPEHIKDPRDLLHCSNKGSVSTRSK